MADRKYDDIICLPHHVSKVHPQLSRESYAAQFSPFAALRGYDDMIEEASVYIEDTGKPEDPEISPEYPDMLP